MRKILVIEDNEMNREILKDLLEDEYEILEAENGAEGLALLERARQQISLILLDLQMPVMNGFEFLSRIHDDPLLSAVPVIVMTADEERDTEERCLKLGAVEFLEKPYNPTVMFARIRNMIRMREAAAEIHSIELDELTGLYTRQAFYHYARKLLGEEPEKPYTVMITDIREFKLINSTYGDAVGDRILRAVAERLGRDAAAWGGIAGRYGADRMIAMFPSEAVPKAEAVEEALGAVREIASVEHIRLKIGVYERVDCSLSINRICDRAISALNTVKHSYTHNVGTYDGPLAQKQREEQQTEAEFYDAIKKREFEAWFQPKVDPRHGRIVAAEALVRWKKPDGSYIPPYRFIPLFEKDGNVAELDEYIFQWVCEAQKQWQSEGKPVVPVSINMSRATLLGPGVVERYCRHAEETGIAKELVPIEITESSAFLSEQIADRMRELKDAGFPLHLDDFGSGYSSLTSLGVLPFDVTKIDKSLTDNIGTPRGEMIVRHMLEVIRELGMESVVEGVETAEQVEILKRLGCDAIQGYYYSKPVPKQDFERMLTDGLPA